MLKAVIFDFDDTLIDWSALDDDYESRQAPHLAAVFDYICQHHPLEDRDAFVRAFREHSRRRWDNSRIDHVAPHMGQDLLSAAADLGVPVGLFEAEALMRAYQWKANPHCVAFPDAVETLTLLRDRGLRLGLVTNAYQPMWARDIELEAFGLDVFFQDCRISAADFGYLKPHPAIFQAALDCLDVEPTEAVFVGDDVNADVVGAQAAGIFAVLRSSKRRVQELNGTQPDSRIDELSELPAVLDSAFPGWGR
jgi:putative hydrolase of the HAD superfamily